MEGKTQPFARAIKPPKARTGYSGSLYAQILAALTFVSSALALAYVWKIVEAAWLKPRPDNAPILRETPVIWGPAWILILATFGFGIYAGPLVEGAVAAAQVFFGGQAS